MDFANLIPIVLVPIGRGVLGWIENALGDGKISTFEWAQLGETVVRLGVIGLATFYGLNGLGIDVSAFGASMGTVALDFILSAMKKSK